MCLWTIGFAAHLPWIIICCLGCSFIKRPTFWILNPVFLRFSQETCDSGCVLPKSLSIQVLWARQGLLHLPQNYILGAKYLFRCQNIKVGTDCEVSIKLNICSPLWITSKFSSCLLFFLVSILYVSNHRSDVCRHYSLPRTSQGQASA